MIVVFGVGFLVVVVGYVGFFEVVICELVNWDWLLGVFI